MFNVQSLCRPMLRTLKRTIYVIWWMMLCAPKLWWCMIILLNLEASLILLYMFLFRTVLNMEYINDFVLNISILCKKLNCIISVCAIICSEYDGILLDYSRQQATLETIGKLFKLAEVAFPLLLTHPIPHTSSTWNYSLSNHCSPKCRQQISNKRLTSCLVESMWV